jgi:hypothetical protein
MAFAITIGFIVLTTIVGAFIRRSNRDKCLVDFDDFMVTAELLDGKLVSGTLRVENTGLEFVYPELIEIDQIAQSSHIMYKAEYPKLAAMLRFHDELTAENKMKREKELKQTYHPSFLRRTKRRTINIAKTIRDSVMEVINMAMSHAKRITPAGAVLAGQDKYVNQIKQGVVGAGDASYEPMIEKYIGHKVVLEMNGSDKVSHLCGVLKDYTKEFVEIMDVDYVSHPEGTTRKADTIVLRKYGTVRNFAE